MKRLLFCWITLALLTNWDCQEKDEILGGMPFRFEKDSMCFDANGGVDSTRISDWGVWIDGYHVFTPYDTIDICGLSVLPGDKLETRWFTIDHQRALLRVQVHPNDLVGQHVYRISVSSGNSYKVLKIIQAGEMTKKDIFSFQ